MRTLWMLFKNTFLAWNEDKAPRLGAALAFYSMLSLGPLLLLILSVAGLFFGEHAVRGEIVEQIDGLVGPEGAALIQQVLASSASKQQGILASLVGLATLLIGASGVFGQLQEAMNVIWKVPPRAKGGFRRLVLVRLFSFAMVLSTGFLMLISLVVSAVLAAIGKYSLAALPGTEQLWQLINQLVGLSVTTLLFAVIFKFVPDRRIAWRDVLAGAALTAVLFTLGKFAIGLYLGQSAFSSTYGAAGSLVVLLVWVYYSSQILFFGAEFAQVYAEHRKARKRA